MKKRIILPPTYLAIFLLTAVGLHFIQPVYQLISYPFTNIGVILVIVGLGLNYWADALFRKSNTTVKPQEKPTTLVTSGFFRFTRNPMYLGMVLMLLGEAVFLGSLITFIFPILFFVIIEWVFLPEEERNLEKAFGKSYISYKKKVRRWI
jgi:protein-S-isoprenylcysteine O-methyltransferase Ste14